MAKYTEYAASCQNQVFLSLTAVLAAQPQCSLVVVFKIEILIISVIVCKYSRLLT